MHIRGLNRWQAFGIHLGLSLVIFVILLAIILLIWYPGVFIHLGGWQGIRIVAAVDLVLGPLLTLIVYNPVKKSLKIDLAIIAALQIGCLCYGVWTVEQQRPMAQILLDDTLYVVPKSGYLEKKIDLDVLEKIPGATPKKIILDLPNDHSANAIRVVKEMFTGNPLHLQTDLYLPVIGTEDRAAQREKLDWLLSRLQYDEAQECYWLPVESSHFNGELCYNTTDGATASRPFTPMKTEK